MISEVIDQPIINPLTEVAARYAAAARGAGTCRAYDSAWRQFEAWCTAQNLEPFSGEATIALHIAGMAQQGNTVSTIDVRLAALQYEYRRADVPLNMSDSVLAPVREGIARTLGTAPRRKAAPVTPAELRPMLASRRPSTDPQGARDRALLLIGFGAALRRSELVALSIGDIEEVPSKGLKVVVRRSKTDQTGAGATIAVHGNPKDQAFCPVAAWRGWMAHRMNASDITGVPIEDRDKPLLCSVDKAGKLSGIGLSDKRVEKVIKAAAKAAGFDEKLFSGHSLRRGLLTTAAASGVGLKKLMNQARQKDPSVALGYIDEVDAWDGNASGAAFGLAA